MLRNVSFDGLDTAVSAKNSKVRMTNTTFRNNRVALDLERSPTTIISSKFINNQIDILANNTPLNIIDSILRNIIDKTENMSEVHVQTNPFKVNAKAKEALKERDEASKRKKYKDVIKTVAEYAGYASGFVALFEFIMKMSGLGG